MAHRPETREADEAGLCSWFADQTPVQYQGAGALPDAPAFGQGDGPRLSRVAFDDPDIAAQVGSLRDDLPFEALVGQRLADGAAGVLGDPVQQGDVRGVAVEILAPARAPGGLTRGREQVRSDRIRPRRRI